MKACSCLTPAFGFKGIPLKDKTPETLDAVYKGQKVLDGSYTIVGVDRKNTPAELTDEKQIASLYYHDLGVYHQINGKNGQTAAEAFETAYLLGKAEEDKKLMIEGLRGLFDESTKVKDFRTAEMYVRKMLQYDDNRPEYLMRLGKTLSTLGKSDEAIDAFDKIISIEPKNGSAYAYKSELLRKSGQTDQAIKILESAVAFGIKSPDIFLELTFLYNSSGDPQNLIKTINICTTWENLVPMDPAIFVKESYSYFKLAGHARKKAEESGDYGEVARLLRLSINSADNGLKYAPEGSEEFIALTSTRKSALDASNAIKK